MGLKCINTECFKNQILYRFTIGLQNIMSARENKKISCTKWHMNFGLSLVLALTGGLMITKSMLNSKFR